MYWYETCPLRAGVRLPALTELAPQELAVVASWQGFHEPDLGRALEACEVGRAVLHELGSEHHACAVIGIQLDGPLDLFRGESGAIEAN